MMQPGLNKISHRVWLLGFSLVILFYVLFTNLFPKQEVKAAYEHRSDVTNTRTLEIRNAKPPERPFHNEKLYKNVVDFFQFSGNLRKAIANRNVKDEYILKNIEVIKEIIRKEEILINVRLSGMTIKKEALDNEPNKTIQNEKKDEDQNSSAGYLWKTNKVQELKKKQQTSQIFEENVQEKEVLVSMPRRNYAHVSPDPSDLQKLSGYLLLIESATDPLPVSSKCVKDIYLLVLVISQPDNFQRRQFIRDSWMYAYKENYNKLHASKKFQFDKMYTPANVVKVVFILGQSKKGDSLMKKVHEEQRNNNDLVIGALMEDYRNLTLKTRLALKWAYYECKSVFTIKTDDDVFINEVMLVEWLKRKPAEKLYTGCCNFNSPVVRNNMSKWYVSYEDYPKDRYPGYCLGGGYLISSDILGAVVKKSYGRKIFPMEDIYIGLIIAEMPNVMVEDQRKHFDLLYTGRKHDCQLNDLFLAHQVFADNLIKHSVRALNALNKDCSNITQNTVTKKSETQKKVVLEKK